MKRFWLDKVADFEASFTFVSSLLPLGCLFWLISMVL